MSESLIDRFLGFTGRYPPARIQGIAITLVFILALVYGGLISVTGATIPWVLRSWLLVIGISLECAPSIVYTVAGIVLPKKTRFVAVLTGVVLILLSFLVPYILRGV